MQETDVAIIGAGPIGIELAAALRREGVDHQLIDAGPIGATLTWWAPHTKFFSSPERIAIAGIPLVVPGQDKATGEQYLDYLRLVVGAHDLRVRTYEPVRDVVRSADDFTLSTIKGQTRARRVVLAIGNMHRPNLIGVPGEDLPHVSHYLADPHVYYGRRVLIVGGKNSAVEAAIHLYRVGARVTISYRRAGFDAKRVKYWLRPELEWLIDKERIAFEPYTCVREIRDEITILDRLAPDLEPLGDTFEHESDVVLLLTGYEQDPAMFTRLGVELIGDGPAPRFRRTTMETNVEGVYVAGTAAAGTERHGVKTFIETAHVHVDRIVAHVTGAAPPKEVEPAEAALPEA
jgi:thioredoxin reductase (NADPH)